MKNHKRIAMATVFILILLGLGACGDTNEKKETYRYQLTENGCPTPTIETSSKSELCEALKDDERNDRCARSLRYEKFKAECPGHVWN